MWGRIFGILFGLKVFGLWGAIIGYAIGRSVDRPSRHTSAREFYRESAYVSSGMDNTLQMAYQTLGITPNTTVSDIKKAYRRLMNQYHPDKLAARELPEGMQKKALEKLQTIRDAYDRIRQAKKFR